MGESAPLIALEQVTLRYEGESGVQALDGVTLTVRRGEHVCVLGANGSGKSTLASVICGLLAPDEGRVTLLGEEVFDDHRTETIDFEAYRRARRAIGLVFQNPDDQIVTTVVEEDVAFGPENLGLEPDEIGRRVERELRRVAMSAFAKADPTRLSGGQKQRVTIAGTLAMEPDLIVFDEPGSLLDVRGRTSIMRVMGKLADGGATIVHITHFMEEATLADRVIVLDQGHVALEGTPAEVFGQAERIASLGLEQPLVARLATSCGLAWTADEDDFVRQMAPRVRTRTDHAIPQKPSAPRPTAQPPAIALDCVGYSYDGTTPVLDGVSFEVPQGGSCAIIGQTGSGKSTLLRLICALEAPDTGTVTVLGTRTAKRRDRRRLAGRIGYVMQHPERQLFARTVLEDVSFGPRNLGLSPREAETRARAALGLVGLYDLESASPFELSGGQQRLCALAGVLAMEPQVLVLDEPTAGLDPRGRRELAWILHALRQRGTTLVQVTHAMEDTVEADQVVVLDRAHVRFKGTPAEVFCAAHEEPLREAGLGLPAPLRLALALEHAGCDPIGEVLDEAGLLAALGVTPNREEAV